MAQLTVAMPLPKEKPGQTSAHFQQPVLVLNCVLFADSTLDPCPRDSSFPAVNPQDQPTTTSRRAPEANGVWSRLMTDFWIKLPRRFFYLIYLIVGQRTYERVRYWYYRKFKKDLGYDRMYYTRLNQSNQAAYDLLAETMTTLFKPQTLVDVGCGSGSISLAFLKLGCREVFAFDGSEASVAMAAECGLPNVSQLDLTQADKIPARGDLCLCLEVAEHLPEKYAAHLCRLLAAPAPVLVFTAAKPRQGGHLHVNTQPRDYWINLMRANGMKYDREAVERAQKSFGGRMIRDYNENLMIFRRVA